MEEDFIDSFVRYSRILHLEKEYFCTNLWRWKEEWWSVLIGVRLSLEISIWGSNVGQKYTVSQYIGVLGLVDMVDKTLNADCLRLCTDKGADQSLRWRNIALKQRGLSAGEYFARELLQKVQSFVNVLRANHTITLFSKGIRGHCHDCLRTGFIVIAMYAFRIALKPW